MPKLCLPLSLFGLVLFSVGTGVAIALPWLVPDGPVSPVLSISPGLFATISACFLGSFALLALYLLLACLRTRLTTADGVIHHVGVFRSRTLLLAEITRTVWQGWSKGGGLVLYTTDDRLVVHFGNYTNGWELAAFFRTALPAEVQERYERFEAAWVPGSEAFRHRQDREQLFFIGLLPVIALGLAVLVFWDPYGLRPWCGAPMGFTMVMGVRALYARWRQGKAAGRRAEEPLL
jgi:hypothetical protein